MFVRKGINHLGGILAMAIVVLAGAFVVPAQNASANHAGTVVWVDDGGVMPPCGAFATPCKKLQIGIDHAAAGEPVAGYITFFTLTLGFVSAFAGGAMPSVVFTQIIPKSHRHGYHVPATLALLPGVAVAAGVNVLLGAFVS